MAIPPARTLAVVTILKDHAPRGGDVMLAALRMYENAADHADGLTPLSPLSDYAAILTCSDTAPLPTPMEAIDTFHALVRLGQVVDGPVVPLDPVERAAMETALMLYLGVLGGEPVADAYGAVQARWPVHLPPVDGNYVDDLLRRRFSTA